MWDPNIHLIKKVVLWEKRHSSLYIRLQPFNWTKNSGKSICKVTTMRGGRLSESQFTRSPWIFPLFWMFNMPVLSRSNHISECQFRNHQAVEAQTIGCNFRVVKRLHYQYNSSQQWSQVLWPAYFWKVLVLMLINFWKQQLTTWPNVQRNLTKACPHPPWFGQWRVGHFSGWLTNLDKRIEDVRTKYLDTLCSLCLSH